MKTVEVAWKFSIKLLGTVSPFSELGVLLLVQLISSKKIYNFSANMLTVEGKFLVPTKWFACEQCTIDCPITEKVGRNTLKVVSH